MNTEEVATKLVEFCQNGEWMKAIDELYAKDIVSVEARAMENMPAAQRENRRTIRGSGHICRAVRCRRD